MNGCISVIIPVYNVEKYLPQCMESVLGQTYRDLEIILIDDGSTDFSGSLCDSYAKRDSRVRVIHQANGGAAAAKNAGLDAATGEYLAFVDSDDFLEPYAYETMLRVLTEEKADVVQCAFREVFTNGTHDLHSFGEVQRMSQVEYLHLYTTDWTACLLWDKLFRRRLFADIYFPVGHVVDDEFFTYQGVMNAVTVVRVPVIVYNYRKRRSSVTAKKEYNDQIIEDKLTFLQDRKTKIGAEYPCLKTPFAKHYFRILDWMSRDPHISSHGLKQIQNALRGRITECLWSGAEIQTVLHLLLIRVYTFKKKTGKNMPPENEEKTEWYFE